jgi:hypothetical protein
VRLVALVVGTQDVAPDAAVAVDGDADGHWMECSERSNAGKPIFYRDR